MSRYIGARYVPLQGGAWDNSREYEPLTVVQYQGDSYTSKTYVPVGAAITNTTYWVKTSEFSQQVANLAQSLQQMDSRVEDIEEDIQGLQSDIRNFPEWFQFRFEDYFGDEPSPITIAQGGYVRLPFTPSSERINEYVKHLETYPGGCYAKLSGQITSDSSALPAGQVGVVAYEPHYSEDYTNSKVYVILYNAGLACEITSGVIRFSCFNRPTYD